MFQTTNQDMIWYDLIWVKLVTGFAVDSCFRKQVCLRPSQAMTKNPSQAIAGNVQMG